MRDQTIINGFQHLEQRLINAEDHVKAMSEVLKNIIGKELLRSQAVQVALMKKNVLVDADIVASLQELIEDSKKTLEAEANRAKEEQAKAVEILVPNSVKANSNQDETPTPAVTPITEA
jgi:tRNA C32,U32 (ribose-2'-O)-methylase TrmJ